MNEESIENNEINEDKEPPKKFCPVIKDTCLRKGCMFYVDYRRFYKEKIHWDCAYVMAYYNLGNINP